MSDGPRVCVVAAAYDRSVLLPDLIAALQAQSEARFEAVLVDNGSSDDTFEHLRRLTAGDERFEVLRIEDNRGPARARNVAWRAARAPWIAFTDDDCAPDHGWLAALLAAGEDADIVQGRTEPVASDQRWGWFDRSQRIERFSHRYETCNLLVPRALLERLGGFDETFRIAMGEDTDLGLRAVAAGARTTFAEDAVVRHHVWRHGFADYLRQRYRWAQQVELMKVNPAARRHLRFGLVCGGTHLLVWSLVPAAVIGIAIGAPWLPLVPALGWCAANTYWSRHKPYPPARRFAYSTLQFVGKVYETLCFVQASVRYRTLVI